MSLANDWLVPVPRVIQMEMIGDRKAHGTHSWNILPNDPSSHWSLWQTSSNLAQAAKRMNINRTVDPSNLSLSLQPNHESYKFVTSVTNADIMETKPTVSSVPHTTFGAMVSRFNDTEGDTVLSGDYNGHSDYNSGRHSPDPSLERNGMVWGMKVESYTAMSARERKRVRNRISARAFRAKRKESLYKLQQELHAKDAYLELANAQITHLTKQVEQLLDRLAAYEKTEEWLLPVE